MMGGGVAGTNLHLLQAAAAMLLAEDLGEISCCFGEKGEGAGLTGRVLSKVDHCVKRSGRHCQGQKESEQGPTACPLPWVLGAVFVTQTAPAVLGERESAVPEVVLTLPPTLGRT